jgi:hypothetical protein
MPNGGAVLREYHLAIRVVPALKGQIVLELPKCMIPRTVRVNKFVRLVR